VSAPEVSVVVVTHQGEAFVEACVRSIRAAVAVPHEILVVDNASRDGTRERVRALEDVQLIALEENLGYGAAANRAVQAARGELVLLLNQDLTLEGSLRPLIERMGADRGLGLLGCSLRYPDGRRQVSLGREHSPLRLCLSWAVPPALPILGRPCSRMVSDEAVYDVPHDDVAWVSGAFLLARRSTWEALGGMDEDIFLYLEDVDLCRRARLAGWRVGYDPRLEALHHEGSGRPWVGRNALACTLKSYGHYTRKHYGPRRGRLLGATLGPVLWLRSGGYALRGALRGSAADRDKARAFRELAWTTWRSAQAASRRA
jgi:N-acetylglucosaminyl-diphospho-decaprenol L-rhamnosyltransferase